MEQKTATLTQQSYLSFRLGAEEYAANVSKVLEILEMPAITTLPHAPAYMKGVINLRGRVLPVLDTRIRFGLQTTENTVNTAIIVINIDIDGISIDVGALVDSVEEVMELSESDMESAPAMGSRFDTSFIEGMVRKDEKFIMVLNMDKVFSDDQIKEVSKLSQKISN